MKLHPAFHFLLLTICFCADRTYAANTEFFSLFQPSTGRLVSGVSYLEAGILRPFAITSIENKDNDFMAQNQTHAGSTLERDSQQFLDSLFIKKHPDKQTAACIEFRKLIKTHRFGSSLTLPQCIFIHEISNDPIIMNSLDYEDDEFLVLGKIKDDKGQDVSVKIRSNIIDGFKINTVRLFSKETGSSGDWSTSPVLVYKGWQGVKNKENNRLIEYFRSYDIPIKRFTLKLIAIGAGVYTRQERGLFFPSMLILAFLL